jgi:hypothetical protein
MIIALIQATPNKSAAIYEAALLIEKCGPMLRAELFAGMDFGIADTRERKLREAFETDWLRETPSGHLELTEYAKRHFELHKPKEHYAGQITPPQYRPDIFHSQGLSKRYIPNSRGPRADVPAWSVREAVKIVTIKRSGA